MTLFFAECLYCDHKMYTATEAEHHACRAEVESWKNRYSRAMVCYKDEETTHTTTIARLVKAQEQNVELVKELEKASTMLSITADQSARLTEQMARFACAAFCRGKWQDEFTVEGLEIVIKAAVEQQWPKWKAAAQAQLSMAYVLADKEQS